MCGYHSRARGRPPCRRARLNSVQPQSHQPDLNNAEGLCKLMEHIWDAVPQVERATAGTALTSSKTFALSLIAVAAALQHP